MISLLCVWIAGGLLSATVILRAVNHPKHERVTKTYRAMQEADPMTSYLALLLISLMWPVKAKSLIKALVRIWQGKL